MDKYNWKKVILQWVTESGYIGRNYISVEQTQIDEFFQNFCMNNKSVQPNKIKPNLRSFLREYYPNFTPQMEDRNSICTTEYLYAYSLLLHFVCLKHPETTLYTICQRLPQPCQYSIKLFLDELSGCTEINREMLCIAISKVTENNVSDSTKPNSVVNEDNKPTLSVNTKNNLTDANKDNKPTLCDNTKKDNPSAVSKDNLSTRTEQQLMEPLRAAVTHSQIPRGNTQRRMPPTSKSADLERVTRKLRSLQTQLEIEHYEKSLLEAKLKQKEENIQVLKEDNKQLRKQIRGLEDTISASTSEQSLLNRSDNEQLNFAEDNENTPHTEELDPNMLVLIDNLQRKDSIINLLKEYNVELEQSMQSFVAACPNLSASLAAMIANRTANIELRKKEQEIVILREALRNMAKKNQKMSDIIQKFIIKIAAEFNLNGNMFLEEGNSAESKGYLSSLSEYVGHFISKIKNIFTQVEVLSDDTDGVPQQMEGEGAVGYDIDIAGINENRTMIKSELLSSITKLQENVAKIMNLCTEKEVTAEIMQAHIEEYQKDLMDKQQPISVMEMQRPSERKGTDEENLNKRLCVAGAELANDDKTGEPEDQKDTDSGQKE